MAGLNYGIENFDYGGNLAYGWLRHGLSENLTGELRGEADNDGAALGGGADLLVGDIGVLLASAGRQARARAATARATSLASISQTPFVSAGARVTRASENYREIGDAGPQVSQSSTAFVRTSFGRSGSLAFSAIRARSTFARNRCRSIRAVTR